MKKIIKLQNYKGSLFAAVILYYLMMPYFVWHSLLVSNFIIIPMSLLLGLLFFRNGDFTRSNMLLLGLFIIICIAYTLVRGRNFNFFISIFPFAFLPFANEKFTKSVFENFLDIYCVITAISLFVWFLHLFNFAPLMRTIAPLNSVKQYDYNVYPLLVSISDNYRFYCVFDEPGVVGTISGIILCIQKFNFKDKRTRILMVAGLCSFSMFFYILCAVYLILYYAIEKKSIYKILFVLLLIYGAFFLIQSVPILNDIFGYRFEWDAETGKFVGDNRTSDVALYYLYMASETNELWFGLKNPSLFIEEMRGECNLYMTLLLNGVILCLFYLFMMICYGLNKKQKMSTFILFIVTFIASVYQRPFLFNAEYIFLWTYLARLDKFIAPNYE